MPQHELKIVMNATTPPQTFTLASGDSIDTTRMSDCTSLVILYQRASPGGMFTSAVGQHGGGGPLNLNVPAIIATVPPADRSSALPLLVSGHNYLHEDFDSMNNRAFRKVLQDLKVAGFNPRSLKGRSGLIVAADGEYSQY